MLQLYLMILLTKEKKTMNEMHENVDYNNLKFEYVGPNKDVRFCECMDYKELLNAIKKTKLELVMY